MGSRKKICIVTSTRADWGLLSPLAQALGSRSDVELQIIATNMHLLGRFGHTVDEIKQQGFEISAKVEMPDTDDDPGSKVRAMAQCMEGMSMALTNLSPDLLVILGDRYEMLAVASAAVVMKIPIAHIAGGEISEGAIDDSIRHAITKLATLHFTATEIYRQRVIQMGESPDRVFNTGALGVWNIMNQPLLSLEQLCESLDFNILPHQTFLVTYHPATLDPHNVGVRVDDLLKALDKFPNYKIVITYPNNDAGSEQIIEKIKDYAKCRPERVLLIKSLGMQRYLSLLKFASAVIGNSSSGIVEVPSMGIPTVDIGIRQRGRIASESVIHCGESADEIASAIEMALSPEMQTIASKKVNPYGRENTLDSMVEHLVSADLDQLKAKKFFDINHSACQSY